MSSSSIKNKTISTRTTTFHASLVEAVLDGFVSLPSSAYQTLESVFRTITTAIETRSKISDNIQQYIISERYEYSPITMTIRSCKLQSIICGLSTIAITYMISPSHLLV